MIVKVTEKLEVVGEAELSLSISGPFTSAPVLIDTGFTGELLLSASVAESLGVKIRTTIREEVKRPGSAPILFRKCMVYVRFEGVVVRVRALIDEYVSDVGNQERTSDAVESPPNLLGLLLLQGCRFSVDILEGETGLIERVHPLPA